MPIAKAVREAKLPQNATAYTLRHSTITDLVTGGLPLLTVAQISGTSAEMIEKHYGHLIRDAAVEALASLALCPGPLKRRRQQASQTAADVSTTIELLLTAHPRVDISTIIETWTAPQSLPR